MLHIGKTKRLKQLLEGGDISRYSVEWNARWWIAYGNWLGAPREPRFFIQPRLLVKQVIDWTTRRLHVGYTEEELYNTQIAFNILGNGKYSLKFLITILNSVLLTWYHKYRFLDAVKQRFQKVLIQDAKSFPVRQIHFTTPDPERNKLSERLIILYEKKQHENLVQMADQLLPRGNDGEFLAFKPGATGSEEKSDVIHDLLCHLADQMMNLNKQKESETRRFLSMLEKELKIQPDRNSNTGIDSFGGKTVIKGYLGDYQKSEDHLPYDALWEVLRKNGRRSGSTLDTAFEQRLKQEYEKSLALLLPIKEKLAATDWLIDQLVYRLYGLTEEEIAIVEGRE